MFVYPWDLGGMETFSRNYPATGCQTVVPALSYHHGDILSARTGRVYRLDKAAVAFTPTSALYGDLQPDVYTETAGQGVVDTLRTWCSATGRLFAAWTVLLHNSTLGARRPDVCMENFAGDRYRHALCPSHPEVRLYCSALIKDICRQFSPDSLIVESATAKTALHGSHHEIANVRIGRAALWLLSLCFCPHCLENAAKRPGLDPERVRNVCAALLDALLNSETYFPGNDSAQVASILLEYPELHAYQLERQERVGELIAVVGAELRAQQVEFKLIPSAAPFPVGETFLEGFSFNRSSQLADVVVPLVYGEGETYQLVHNNMDLLGANARTGMALTLHPACFPGKEDFLAAVATAAEKDPYCAYFYNYSLASSERLSWVADATAILNKEAT